jgi:hypothetical protein
VLELAFGVPNVTVPGPDTFVHVYVRPLGPSESVAVTVTDVLLDCVVGFGVQVGPAVITGAWFPPVICDKARISLSASARVYTLTSSNLPLK